MELQEKYTKQHWLIILKKQKEVRVKHFLLLADVYQNKKEYTFERIIVPFSDGIKSLNVVTDLKKAYDTLKENSWLPILKKHYSLPLLMKPGKSTYAKWTN